MLVRMGFSGKVRINVVIRVESFFVLVFFCVIYSYLVLSFNFLLSIVLCEVL